MLNNGLKEIAEKSKQIYDSHFRERLKKTHMNDFVAIEPESRECFLGKTLSEAAAAARAKYPTRLTHVIRVGHEVALHLGATS